MVRTINYRDLTVEQRRRGAAKTRERLMGVLNQPFLSNEQRAAIWEKIELVGRWERLALD